MRVDAHGDAHLSFVDTMSSDEIANGRKPSSKKKQR